MITTQPTAQAAKAPAPQKHAPGKVLESVSTRSNNFISIAWDKHFFDRDRQAGIATNANDARVVAAWAGSDFAPDTVKPDLTKADEYERAMVQVFAGAVAANEAGLQALQSNLAIGAKYQPKNGTFDFVFDRPGTDNDLRYVGLIEAAPAPIRAILDAAAGFQKHF